MSEPLYEEDLDGAAGVLFPFYDPDTHMLYLAGKVTKHTNMFTQKSLHLCEDRLVISGCWLVHCSDVSKAS